MFRRAWYEVQQGVKVDGTGPTVFRKVFHGRMRECRHYVDKVMTDGEALRVVKVTLIVGRVGRVDDDHEQQMHRTQALADVRDVLIGHFPELRWSIPGE